MLLYFLCPVKLFVLLCKVACQPRTSLPSWWLVCNRLLEVSYGGFTTLKLTQERRHKTSSISVGLKPLVDS
jgi:hypothetical protein